MIPFLRSLYDNKPELPRDEEDYRWLLQEIELFGVSSQVFYLLNERGLLKQTPSFFSGSLLREYIRGLQLNLYMKSVEEKIWNALEKSCIHAIPLKGIQFADRYFGHYGARMTSDIDLYVPRVELDQAIECLKAEGYEYEVEKDHHVRMFKGDLVIELHWTFDKQYWSDLDPEPFWGKSESFKHYRYIRQLSDQMNFYFICLHSARHQMDSVRYLLDIVQMLHRSAKAIDFNSLFRQAKQDKTFRRLRTVLTIVYEQFPDLQQAKPLRIRFLRSSWNYETIRKARLGMYDLRYFTYKFYFKHLIFDSWKHVLKSVQKSY